jgi:SAM-dependent methyltransferase
LGTCSASQAIELARLGHNLVGSDIADTAIAKAHEALAKNPDVSVEIVKDDITSSNFKDGQFDLILDRGCYHSICCFNTNEYIANIKRILKPGGILLLKTMSSEEKRFVAYDRINAHTVIQMPFHFTAEKLLDIFSPHFTSIEVRDSFFYSTVVKPPAQARFAIIVN